MKSQELMSRQRQQRSMNLLCLPDAITIQIGQVVPYKEGKVSLSEAIYKIMHDQKLIAKVKLADSSDDLVFSLFLLKW